MTDSIFIFTTDQTLASARWNKCNEFGWLSFSRYSM